MQFNGKTVIVTGGTGALGTTLVGLLLAAGARVHVPCRSEREAEAFPYRDRVTLLTPCELTDETAVARLYAEAPGLWASIHLAGAFAMGPLAGSDKALLTRMLNANLVSAYLCSRAALGAFGPAGGRIVNVAARAALEPSAGAGSTAYAASKAAVAGFTAALAAELREQKILVNAVAPSIIATPANRAAMPEANHALWPTPEEISAVILFLASEENRLASGAIVPVFGRA